MWGSGPLYARGEPPHVGSTKRSISKPIESSAGALAVALGQPRPRAKALNFFKREILLSTQLLLFIGNFVYLAVGGACGLTYVTNVGEVPGLLKIVVLGFGG